MARIPGVASVSWASNMPLWARSVSGLQVEGYQPRSQALGLANIGLYGILAYSVNHRKREIGLRMALGAARASVLRLILKQGMSLVATGVLTGLAAALFLGRLVSRMPYGVSAGDPISVAGRQWCCC